jgi:hypothetical protein
VRDVVVAEYQIAALHAGVIEHGVTNDGIAGSPLVAAMPHLSRQYPGRVEGWRIAAPPAAWRSASTFLPLQAPMRSWRRQQSRRPAKARPGSEVHMISPGG